MIIQTSEIRHIRVEMAPLQGYTDALFRQAYYEFFQGIDGTYCPFIRVKKVTIGNQDLRKLREGLTEGKIFTPQIIAGSPAEARILAKILKTSGYERVNINFGCPFPKETQRKRGAGSLPYPELVQEILSVLSEDQFGLKISVKTRLGLEETTEFGPIVAVLNQFELKSVIIHARTGKQGYRGVPDWVSFGRYAADLKAPVIANGDLFCTADVQRLLEKYPFIEGVMLGRGILKNPFLPAEIKGIILPDDSLGTLQVFHNKIFESVKARLQSPRHILDRMHAFWVYFSESFDDSRKWAKKIRKTKTIKQYTLLVEQVFNCSGS